MGASGGNTGSAMSASKDAPIDVALTRGQEQHCEGPNLMSAAAAASRGQVVCGPLNRGERNIAAKDPNRRCMIRGERLP